MRTIQLVVAVSTLLSATRGQNLVDVVDAFTVAAVIPDVLSVFQPTAFLQLVFPASNISNTSVSVDSPGPYLTINQTHLEPAFYITSDNGSFTGFNQTFVLVGVDPDAPIRTNATRAQFRHLLSPSMTINSTSQSPDGKMLLVNTTQAISPYIGPAPTANSGWHRYVFLLYIQPANFLSSVDMNIDAEDGRIHWNISAFAEQMGLGTPVAGTFFSASGANDTSLANGTVSSSSVAGPTSTSTSAFNSTTRSVLVDGLLVWAIGVLVTLYACGL